MTIYSKLLTNHFHYNTHKPYAGKPKRCWSMEQLAVSDDFGSEFEAIDELLSISSNTTETYPDIVLEECDGLCVIEAAYTIDARSGWFCCCVLYMLIFHLTKHILLKRLNVHVHTCTTSSHAGALSSTGAAEAARYCDTTTSSAKLMARGRHCEQELSGDDDFKNVSIVCYCQTDACNAFWAQALQCKYIHMAKSPALHHFIA